MRSGAVSGGRAAAEWEAVVVGALACAWRWRLEFALLGVAVGLQRVLARPLGEPAAAGVVGALGATVALVAPVRRLLWRALRRAWLRRVWEHAAIDAGLADGPLRAPRVLSADRVPAADVLRVRVRRGQSVLTVAARADELAACLRVREVRVEADRADAAIACVTLVRRDPFEDAGPVTWPAAGARELSLWDALPLGVDEQGQPVRVGLVERNMLVGGEPGAGKSVALSLLVAAGALDPTARVWLLDGKLGQPVRVGLVERNMLVGGEPGAGNSVALSLLVAAGALDPTARVWLLDGKLVELAVWAPVAERLVGPDGPAAIALLRELQAEMEARYRELLARGLRKVRRADGLPLHLLVCDELAFYLSAPDRKQRQQFAELLRDLVARGRAAGVIVVAATQKPGADVVPSALRDLFGFRLALRCNTPQASDTILGQGWASAGADASTVPGGQRGVGYLLAEGERPQRTKTFHLSDHEVAAIAERATARRADAWLAAGAPTAREQRA